MTDERITPPLPASSATAALTRKPSTESDFWAGLFLDLCVRVEWLGQALDAVPKADASMEAVVRLRSYARAVSELLQALENVQEHRRKPHLKPLFSLEGSLAGYLSRLYAWCEEIGNDFERMAVALRRRQATTIVFSHRDVNTSYSHFHELIAAMRRANEIARELHGGEDPEAWRALDEHLEELIWATEWLHMTLARPPGG
jgi:hypothetical protein